ncbi:MAG: GEVED domain-containing protein [Bacteroidota bacterium]
MNQILNNYCLCCFFLCCFTFSAVNGQQLDHVLGEILIQFEEGVSHELLIQQIRNEEKADANIAIKRQLSTPSPIHLLTFDQNAINEFHFLDRLRRHPKVIHAQFNHFVESRVIPNDPMFGLQWHFINDGTNGGLVDADLDIDMAWDQTTGGLTETGDSIVICVVDEGFDLGHEDFGDNIWRNYAEIPNNGIDDDGNGFIDDYLGWNVMTSDDDIVTDNEGLMHGTPVTGIIGAKGNNGIGVSGVNWNVKLMIVVRGNTEAEILEAYSYPFFERQKFNESAGSEGSFVVAINTSWGINFGQPSNSPLWCAFYDSLGSVGIVSPAATINSEQDVDVVGDLPTACPSEFLISLTSIDNTNTKVPNAGYGASSIDMAAYGKMVATTAPNNEYIFVDGTSLTSPQVSGTIALMYAACPSLAALAKSNPPEAAIQAKNIILSSTVPNPSLQGITVQAGHLNINKCFENLLANCDFSGCYGPYFISTSEIQGTSATLNWIADSNNNSVNLRYRKKGASNWIQIENLESPHTLTELTLCTDYEYQLKPVCDDFPGIFSSIIEFQTDGCCVPPSSANTIPSADAVQISWSSVLAAESYALRYRNIDSLNWNQIESENTSVLISQLTTCTNYEFQIKSYCDGGADSAFSDLFTFVTKDCGLCLDLSYCPGSGPNLSSNTWISEVNVGAIQNSSANENGGYSKFTFLSTELFRSYYEFVELKTDHQFFESESIFKIWIDYNQNGEFEEDQELAFDPVSKSSEKIGYIAIPSNAKLGSTRMRIAVRDEDYPACGTWGFSGEVEDYCVDIIEATGCLKPLNIRAVGEGTSATATWFGLLVSEGFTLRLSLAGKNDWQYFQATGQNFVFENLIPCTAYELQVQTNCADGNSEFTSSVFFETSNCGACLDQDYCTPPPAISTFEWIKTVSLNTLYNESDGNNGYTFFDQSTTDLIAGNTYTIELSPDFANSNFEEYFRVWIDFNQDGQFNNEEELVFAPDSSTSGPQSGTIMIPIDALEGSTRMRVSMKYQEPTLDACDGNYGGEIEDYCINIFQDDNSACPFPSASKVFAVSPFAYQVIWQNQDNVSVYHLRYRLENSGDNWITLSTTSSELTLDNLSICANYEYQIQTICELGISAYSESFYLVTDCVTSIGQNTEWAAGVHIFPNPFVQQIELKLPSPGVYEVALYDLQGTLQDYHEFEIRDYPSAQLMLKQGLPSGVYWLKIKQGDRSTVRKVVKLIND